MINLQIVIGDYDQRYVQKLASYLMNVQDHHFSVKTFSEIPPLKEHLQNNPTDILLLTEKIFFEIEAIAPMLILLVENTMSSSLKDFSCINKYQSGERFVQQLMHYYTNQSSKELTVNKSRLPTKLWGIYSPCGGSGKTTLALGLGNILASKGENTLFISLEEFPSYARFFEPDGQTSISDLLYHARKKTENLQMKLEGILRVEKTSGMKYLPPPIFAQDIMTYEDEDWKYLIEQLLVYSKFQHIIIDFTCAMSTRNLMLMKKCKKLLVLTNLSFLQNAKVEAFLQGHQESQNIFLAANLTKPYIEEAVSSIQDLPIRLTLPFSQELYSCHGTKVILREQSDFMEVVESLEEVLSSD